MTVYVFGNPDWDLDNRVFEIIKRFPDLIDFRVVNLNEDLPITDKKEMIILDTVQGIGEVTVLDENNLDGLTTERGVSAHDYDLGFQLKYLRKLGKLNKVKIIGIPQTGKIDYLRIQSIFKKLVAQDIQGS